jgi:hypothetical protein
MDVVEKSGKRGKRFVTVRRAPEPTDLFWENITMSRFGSIGRKLCGWAVFVALLAVSIAIQIALTSAAERERNTRLSEERLQAASSAVRFSSAPAS